MFDGAQASGGPGEGGPIDQDVYLKFAFYFLFDLRLPEGRTVAETFLQRAGWQVGRAERALIERFGAARLRPYEVQEVREDEGLGLRDLWNDREVWVTERVGTHQLKQWDILAARVAPEEDGTLRFEGGLYLLPRTAKQSILAALGKEARRLRGGAPAADEDRLLRETAPLFHRFWLDHVVHRPRSSPPRATCSSSGRSCSTWPTATRSWPPLGAIPTSRPKTTGAGRGSRTPGRSPGARSDT
jgi:hypothetical protein